MLLINARAIVAGVVLLVHAGTSLAFQQLVTNAGELEYWVAEANRVGGDAEITLADGEYTLNNTLQITAPHITIRSQSGNPKAVVIQGDAMSPNAAIGNLFRVSGRNFELSGVTLRRARWHLIQIVGEADADHFFLNNCVMQDAYEQLLKVTTDGSSTGADSGIVEQCLFEYTAGIGPNWYIGGIDAHNSDNWIIRDNVFRDIASPHSNISEFAIHFWSDSQNTIVERNLIIDSDRGIGFGLSDRGHIGGVIQNNIIVHSDNGDPFADVGISLESSENTIVRNNTLYLQHGYPNAIEYRFTRTAGVSIYNNIANKGVVSRDGGSGRVFDNVTNAQASWFVNVSQNDLHLSQEGRNEVPTGEPDSAPEDDFDGDARPTVSYIGADHSTASVTRPNPPVILQNTP